MNTILTIVQLVLAILLTVTVLLQQKGTALGSAFGGAGNVYSTKRGVEKILFRATIVIAILFFAVSLYSALQ